MSNKPLVSVIIPTHDRPESVTDAVRSVLAQTYRNLELIVVDVGITKRARSALKEFIADPRFVYIEHPTELLGGAARNIGVKHASGDYLAFLDDDDAWVSEKLEAQMGALMSASAEVGFSFTAVANDYGKGMTIISQVEDGVKDFSELAFARMKGFLTVTLIIKKAAFDMAGGFDESLPSHQDPELILRIAQKWKGLAVNKPFTRVNMRQDHDSVGKSLTRRIAGREMVIEKHRVEFEKRPKVLAKHYFQLGLWYRDSGNKPKAKEYFRKAFQHSWNVRYLIHRITSLK